MPQQKGAQRFFSDYYDSLYQRGYGPKCRDDKFERVRVLGRMRLDIMLARKLVILDTQLLDGSFLLDQRPVPLLSLITRVGSDEYPPIEVRARYPSLQDALVGFVVPSKRDPVEPKEKDQVRPKDEKLKGFSFSSIENDEQRTAAKQALEQTDATKVKSWEDIGPLLKSFGVAKDNVERMVEGWRRWIQAQEDGLLEVKKWEGRFELDEHLPRPGTLRQRLDTDQAKDAIDYVYETRFIRNNVDTHLTELREEHNENKKVLEELDGIDAWYNLGYNATVADQHNCKYIELVRDQDRKGFENSNDKHIDFRDGTSADLLEQIELEGVDPLYRLGTMDGFKRLFWEENNIRNFEDWWNGRDSDALKRGLESFSNAITKEWVSPDKEYVGNLANAVGDALSLGTRKAMVTLWKREIDTRSPSKRLTQRILNIAQARVREEADG